MLLFRHLLAILTLPLFVVAGLPFLLLGASPPGESTISWQIAGAVIFGLGFLLAIWCFTLFARVGKGTVMPWDPTQELVQVGPYRYMRNPMITGVLTMLVGETIFWRFRRIWAVGAGLFADQPHLFHRLRRAGIGETLRG